jgi:hypothetical protein
MGFGSKSEYGSEIEQKFLENSNNKSVHAYSIMGQSKGPKNFIRRTRSWKENQADGK